MCVCALTDIHLKICWCHISWDLITLFRLCSFKSCGIWDVCRQIFLITIFKKSQTKSIFSKRYSKACTLRSKIKCWARIRVFFCGFFYAWQTALWYIIATTWSRVWFRMFFSLLFFFVTPDSFSLFVPHFPSTPFLIQKTKLKLYKQLCYYSMLKNKCLKPQNVSTETRFV